MAYLIKKKWIKVVPWLWVSKVKDTIGVQMPILQPFNSKKYNNKIIYPRGFGDIAKSSKENRIYTGGSEEALSYDDTLNLSLFASDTLGNPICHRNLELPYPYFYVEVEFVGTIPSGGVLYAGNLLPLGGKRTAVLIMMDKACNVKKVIAKRAWGADITSLFENRILVSVYPNPSQDKIRLNADIDSKMNYKIVIEDANGNVCIHKEWQLSDQLDIAKLSAGIYFISILNKDAVIGMAKFVKL
ncbi:MAG: T9SS type A sorting domain-containing protein [Bacteroidetes bacterium]|nr:T9SS type A sorting domain-containing protein [Bacteroidota bacterium]